MNTFLFIAAVMAAIAASAVALPLLRNRHSRILGAVAGVLVIGAAAGLYPLWSNWDWRTTEQPKAVSPEVLAMVDKLAKHMQEEPNDATGWLLLGRSYLQLERTDDAIVAFDHAHRLDANNTEAMLGLGEAMSMRAGGNITPAAVELFEKAVSVEPQNPKALLYSGFSALARGDRAAARSRWQALKALHPPPQIEAMLDQRIAELGSGDLAAAPQGGPSRPAPASAAGASVGAAAPGAAAPSAAQATVNLSIAPALKSRLTADTPLFVFAREPGSQGPPLAAKRLTSSAIGTQIHLSPADSMMPTRVLAPGQRVSITARVSFSGQPLPAAGDLYGELTYEVGRDGVRELVIDRVAQ